MAAGGKPHAVCVPFPAQGHVTPMMKLAKVLYCKGFHVTFVNTEYNHRRLIRSRGPQAVAGLPGFRFATIPDGLPESDADATQDPDSLCDSTMRTCLPHLKGLLDRLNSDAGVPPVTCVVADNVMSFAVDAAKDIGVPCLLFWTASACGYMGYRHFQFLIDEGLAPFKDEAQLTNGYLDTPVGWARGMSKHIRLRDFPTFIYTMQRGDILLDFMMREVSHADAADAVILNTFFDELEPAALDAMRAILPPVYTIGPLSLLLERLAVADAAAVLGTIRSSLWKEDLTCLRWLQGGAVGGVRELRVHHHHVQPGPGGVRVGAGEQRLRLFVDHPARPGEGRRRRAAAGVRGVHQGQVPPGELVRAGGRAAAPGGGGVPDAQRVELHDGEPQRRRAHVVLALLRGAADQLPVRVYRIRVGRRDGGRRRRAAGGSGGDDTRGNGRRQGEGDEAMKRRAEEWKEAAVRATRPGGTALANLDDLINNHILPPKPPSAE